MSIGRLSTKFPCCESRKGEHLLGAKRMEEPISPVATDRIAVFQSHLKMWSFILNPALVPVPELPKSQSWTDLLASKSICDNRQLEGNSEHPHQGMCTQNGTPADFWKDLLSICILCMPGKISLQTNIKRFFFWICFWGVCAVFFWPFLLSYLKWKTPFA